MPEEPVSTFPFAAVVGTILLVLLFAALTGLGVFLFRHRKNVYIYVPGDQPRDYKLIAKLYVKPTASGVNIMDLEPYPEDVVAIEIKRPLAKKLLGQEFIVHHRDDYHVYTICSDRPSDWHEFRLSEDHNLDDYEEDSI